MTIVVVGAGVFGLTAALELRARGHAVSVLDPGPIPHPLAESTDVSKVVRLDYGADAAYTELGERALEGWRRWNARWPAPLFHETGVTFLAGEPMRPGGFEHESFALLTARGHAPVRLDAAAIAARFPAYRPGALVDGYVNPLGGWAASGAVVAQLAADARAAGVVIREGARVDRIVDDGVIAGDQRVPADRVIVCAGAWAARLVPELAGVGPRDRPAGVPPAPGRSGAVRGRAVPGVRRRHLPHRLLRVPGDRGRRGQDREPRDRRTDRLRRRARRVTARTRPSCAGSSPRRSPRSPGHRSPTAGCASTATPSTATSGSRRTRRARRWWSRPAARATRSSSRRCSAR